MKKLLIQEDQIEYENKIYNIKTGMSPQEIQVYGLVGFVGQSLYYVEDAQMVSSITNKKIYEIKSVNVIGQKDINIISYFTQGMYFSYDYNLSAGYYDQNSIRQSFIISLGHLPLMQGYIGQFMDQQLQCILISRRQWKRGGTRYNHRGIDEQGNSANFVESELIIKYNDTFISHLQIRGSVPLHWQSNSLGSINIEQDRSMQIKGFKQHFQQLQDSYGLILCINLMSQKKQYENTLTKEFEKVLEYSNLNYVKYLYLDFHNICESYQYSKILPHLPKSLIDQFSYYTSTQQQQGIIRTSCLDCLDRTNQFQTQISLYITSNIFKSLNIKEESLKLLQLLWNQNGDQISKQYAGTNAITTNQLYSNIFGSLVKGCQRLCQSTLFDNQKQQAYESIVSSQTLIVPKIQTTLKLFLVNYSALEVNSNIDQSFDIIIITTQQLNNDEFVKTQYDFVEMIQNNYKGYELVIQQQYNNQGTFIFMKDQWKKQLISHNNLQNKCLLEFIKFNILVVNVQYELNEKIKCDEQDEQQITIMMGDFNQNVELNENTTLTQKYDKLTQQLDDSTYEDLITFQPRAYKNGLQWLF